MSATLSARFRQRARNTDHDHVIALKTKSNVGVSEAGCDVRSSLTYLHDQSQRQHHSPEHGGLI